MSNIANLHDTAAVLALPAGWLAPITPQQPCGPSLEYDHDYAVLAGRMAPRTDAQYGNFVGAAETPNWADIERDCQKLLLRTKDIYLLVWLCRARTRLRQAAGLADVLTMLAQLLHTWPDAVHPQRVVDGDYEPALCANALAALADPEGLLGDICDITLASHTALRLTVRDVERAFAVPRHPSAPTPDAVRQQLLDLRAAAREDEQSPIRLLGRASIQLRAIDAWAKDHLGDDAPVLRPLSRILDLFAEPVPPALPANPAVERTSADDRSAANLPAGTAAHDDAASPGTRAEVTRSIRAAREWLETHEPSSPASVLLKQAERMIGKRFSHIADAIPMDLLKRWDMDDETTEAAGSTGAGSVE